MPKDYLTSLPPELFDYICDFVHLCGPKTPFAKRRQYLGSISKAFLPSARRRVFQSITVDDESQAVGLLHVLATSPGAARSVTSLRLSLPENALSKEIIKANVLDKALSNLAYVEIVSLNGASRLAETLLSPHWDGPWASLRLLDVTGRFEGWGDPFALYFYRYIGRYRALLSLTVNVQSKPEGRSLPAKATGPITRPVKPESLCGLTLRGVTTEVSSVKALVAWLSPQTLSIESRSGIDSPMSSRLIRLPCSVGWLHLDQKSTLSEDLSPVLSHLRYITALTLWEGFDYSTILPLLGHKLPKLNFLHLLITDSLTTHRLLKILSGPDKVVTLDTLFLTTPRDLGRSAQCSLAPEALIEVVEVAEKENVTSVGTIVDEAKKAKAARDASL